MLTLPPLSCSISTALHILPYHKIIYYQNFVSSCFQEHHSSIFYYENYLISSISVMSIDFCHFFHFCDFSGFCHSLSLLISLFASILLFPLFLVSQSFLFLLCSSSQFSHFFDSIHQFFNLFQFCHFSQSLHFFTSIGAS